MEWLARAGILTGWAISSIVSVEIVRDLYHALGHVFPALYRFHGWHHRVFKPNLTPFNDRIYRQAQWYNDLPESIVMFTASCLIWWTAWQINLGDYGDGHWGAGLGVVYAMTFIFGAIVRGLGISWAHERTDLTHMPGPFDAPPKPWFVNRTYHWRHHFDNQDAYFCGVLTLLDRWLGTALSLKNKTVAVTGASGTLGQALLIEFIEAGAKVIALTSQDQSLNVMVKGETIEIPTHTWQVGQENQLQDLLKKVDILVINHGINHPKNLQAEAIINAYEVNSFSALRLMDLFLNTVQTNREIARKELWVNTSEAEVLPAFSPLYELSKRALGDFVTMRRLTAPCVIRKLILGPFKSNLNPIGVMSAAKVAKKIIRRAKGDTRNIIVTIDPLTFLFFPIHETLQSLYFRLCTPTQPSLPRLNVNALGEALTPETIAEIAEN